MKGGDGLLLAGECEEQVAQPDVIKRVAGGEKRGASGRLDGFFGFAGADKGFGELEPQLGVFRLEVAGFL